MECLKNLKKIWTQDQAAQPDAARGAYLKMKAQNMVERIKIEKWAKLIRECQESELSVRKWCGANGISTKTYYYRRKRVREEFLETMSSGDTALMLKAATYEDRDETVGQMGMANRAIVAEPAQNVKPVFATFPIPQGKGAAVTVWLGGYSVDIQNGADGAVVEQVLKVVSRL